MSIKAYILSLPKDVERRRLCDTELTELGMCHVFSDALCGDELEAAKLLDKYDATLNRQTFKRPLSRNEIACSLGHRKIWKQIATSSDAISIVLEDDATFLENPKSLILELASNVNAFQDVMIKLDGVAHGNAKIVNSIGDHDLLLSDRLPPRTTGYVLGRRAAAQLLALDRPISRPVDIDLKFYWEHNVPILTLGRAIVAERQETLSNIEAERCKTKSGSPITRFMRNLTYQAQYTLGRLKHPVNAVGTEDALALGMGRTETL